MDMAVMVLVIEDMDTEVTMARDLLMLRLMLSQDTTDMEVMVLVMDMEVMVSDMEDTEDTMERDLLMLSQDITDTEAMDMVDTEVMEVMDMVEDITDKKQANLVQYFIENGPLEVRKSMIDSLTAFLVEVGEAGEASEEFMELYQKLLATGDWKYYLAVKGVPQLLARLITKEITIFGHLEVTRLSSDLALGYAVKQLTLLLSQLLQHSKIKMVYKSRLVSDVLGGYLSLRRLVVQRTKMIDETQDSLLELLEDLTTGTEEETKAFMSVCIETDGKYPPED